MGHLGFLAPCLLRFERHRARCYGVRNGADVLDNLGVRFKISRCPLRYTVKLLKRSDERDQKASHHPCLGQSRMGPTRYPVNGDGFCHPPLGE